MYEHPAYGDGVYDTFVQTCSFLRHIYVIVTFRALSPSTAKTPDNRRALAHIVRTAHTRLRIKRAETRTKCRKQKNTLPSRRRLKTLREGVDGVVTLAIMSDARRAFSSCAGFHCLALKGTPARGVVGPKSALVNTKEFISHGLTVAYRSFSSAHFVCSFFVCSGVVCSFLFLSSRAGLSYLYPARMHICALGHKSEHQRTHEHVHIHPSMSFFSFFSF